MNKVGEFICKNKLTIIILSLIFLVLSLIGYANTKINYDILVYLPDTIETMKGQDILKNDFDMGAFTIISVDNSSQKEIIDIEDSIRNIDGVNKVLCIDDVIGTTIPFEILPDNVIGKVKNGDSTLVMVTFNESTSNSKTLDAIEDIRTLMNGKAKVGGMSAIVLDTMNLSNKEVVIYVVIAVALCLIVLMLSLDSYLVPVLLLLNIGIAIMYNMGTNVFFGEISYITKAISAVLQLGVTTDFSIFLYHKYQYYKTKEKNIESAMVRAISDTMVSVIGSSLTTIAGFLALCSMNLTLGKDIGLVMAKGVLFGVACVLTVFPAMLLIFDKQLEKTKHKELLPQFNGVRKFTVKHYKAIFALFLLLLVPAYIGNSKSEVYYNLDRSLPSNLDSIVANKELKEKFDIVSPEVVIVDANLSDSDMSSLIDDIKSIEGISLVLSTNDLTKYGFPLEILDSDLTSMVKNDKYQLLLVNSEYEVASDSLNKQIVKVNDVVKEYDKNAIIAGEGPLTNDLIKISDEDFNNVNYVSIGVIFVIMLFVLKSLSLPVLLISAIEFAIFVNVSVSYYTGVTLPFIASIVIGTIQLGATIDYAILMTTKYLELRSEGRDKFEAIDKSLKASISSIFVSGMCFFAATIGVGLYTDLELIGSICTLISRGAIISMLVVIFILPSLLLIFDKLICKTTACFKKEKVKMKNKKLAGVLLAVTLLLPCNLMAATKDETVYSKLNTDGSVNKTIVSNHISGLKTGSYYDRTNLSKIVNVNGKETYKIEKNNLTWDSKGEDLYYRGESSENLPINVSIKYYLNNEETNYKDMIGESGDVKIVIKYSNTLKNRVSVNGSKQTLYTPFMVGMISTLDKKNNSNLTVSNGKVMDNGLNYTILGVAVPGMYESLNLSSLKNTDTITIKYTTKSYEFNNIYNIATSNLFDDDIDFSELNKIYSSINKLSDSTKLLVDGSKKLSEGINDYGTKFNTYANSINTLDTKVKYLNQKYNELYMGINQMDESVNGMVQYAGAFETLNNAVTTLSGYTNAMVENSDKLNTTINGTVQKLTEHIVTLEKIKATTIDSETANLLDEEIKKLTLELQNAKLDELGKEVSELDTNVKALNKNTEVLAVNGNKIVTGLSSTKESVDKLTQGAKELGAGLNTLSSSVSELNAYAKEFNKSTLKLVNGANTLSEGLNTLNIKGISKISSVANGKLKTTTSKLEKMTQLAKNYNSFSMKDKNSDGSTKFIMIVSE